MEEIAKYNHNNGQCGYTAAVKFQKSLNAALEKTASNPLQNSSDWGNPQRRAFFDCKGQYTLILIFSPPTAKTNEEVAEVIYSNIYPSRSSEGNKPYPESITFNADDILKD